MSDEFTKNFFEHYIAKAATGVDVDDIRIGSISEMALDIFADVTIYQLTKYAKEIRKLLDHSGRTQPNGQDVFDVLWRNREDMRSITTYIVDKASSMDMMIREYPVAQQSRFYSKYDQEIDKSPFRAAATEELDRPPSEHPLPHIPKFFPSPFGEDGLEIGEDEDIESEFVQSVIRKQPDDEIIQAAVDGYGLPGTSPFPISIGGQLVEDLVNSLMEQKKENPTEDPNNPPPPQNT